MNKSKLVIAILALTVAFCGVFAACSADGVKPPEEGETITLDTAVIKNADSISLIKSYDPAELGLDGTWEQYDWIAHKSDGVYIDKGKYKGYYVRVEVGTKSYNDDGTFTVDVAGVYLISYDGETLLSYNSETDEYTQIQNVHDIPEVTLPAESTTAAEDTTEAGD